MGEYRVNGMSCAACVAHVEKAVRKVSGVDDVNVNLLTNSMTITGAESPGEVCLAVAAAGYEAIPLRADAPAGVSDDDVLSDKETPRLVKRLIFSVVILCPLMYLSMGHMMFGWPLPSVLEGNHAGIAVCQMLLSGIVLAINQKFFISGTKSVLHGSPNMDTLVAMGSGVSFLASVFSLVMMTAALGDQDTEAVMEYMDRLYFESAAMIVTLITVGKSLEAYSKGRTTDALKGLINLTPKTATVIRDGARIEIPAEQLLVGDEYVVFPGESIPVDGIVISGQAAIDTSAMTGESIPCDVDEGDEVTGGTINISGNLTCRALRVGSDTTLSRIIKLVGDAASTKAPIARLADKVAAIFVPAVLLVAVITAAVWILLGAQPDFALTHAIAVLVISCPCALGLATPVAIMVGSGVGARNGILFKTAEALETAGDCSVVVLDKTGTITVGSPRVTDVLPNETVSVERLLSAAGMLESKSEHPLAAAVMEHIRENKAGYPEPKRFKVLSGMGIRGSYKGSRYYAGRQAYIYEKLQGTDGEDDFISFVRTWKPERYEKKGKTAMFFACDNMLLGAIMVADTMREEAASAISDLKTLGTRVVMLTGDNERTASSIGRSAGVEAVIAGVLPQTKEYVIRRLQRRVGKVVMVGDGINDAPALTAADSGFAIGAGTDIAIDAADVVLTQSRLSDVSRALVLSRGVKRNIKENLFWAFIYNVIGIPLAAGIFYPLFGIDLSPMFGALAMSLSSICVVLNALRLNLIRLDRPSHYRRKRPATSIKKVISKDVDIDKNRRMLKNREDTMIQKNMSIDGMMCAHCQARVKEALEKIDGVSEAKVSHEAGSAIVSLSKEVTDEVLSSAVTDAGYEVKSIA